MSPSSRSTFASALALALLLRAAPAHAQACCAGSGVVTPARLVLDDDALVGLQLRAAHHLGSHDARGEYVPTPSHARELNFEQNVFGAIRVLKRGQVAALVPFVETHRRAAGRSSTGGGLGDINFAARYDVLLAGQSQLVPGLGLLAGVTLPTGRTAEAARNPLATDATGIGAVQVNGGVALEQAFGAWFFGVSGLASLRTARTVGTTQMRLAPQYTLLLSAGHAFESGATAAVIASYMAEGDATANGARVPESARRVISLSVAGMVPLGDQLRLLASVSANPPRSSFGMNQPVTTGATLGVIWSYL